MRPKSPLLTAQGCAAGANDPECRMEKKATDEYLREVPLLIDGTTDEERKTPAAGTAWREAWDDGAEFDLSALPETDEDILVTIFILF